MKTMCRPAEASARMADSRPETTSRLEKYEAERRMLTGHGLDDYEVDVFVTHFLQIAAGDLANVSDTVPKLTGRPAQSLEEYLRQHPESCRL